MEGARRRGNTGPYLVGGMNLDAAIGLVRLTPLAPGRVRQIEPPQAARELCTLPRVDYREAFLLEAGPVPERTGEQWARVILEGASPAVRRALTSGWTALGLQLGSTRSDDLVHGWEVRRSAPDFALLAARSPLGLSAELLFKRRRKGLLFAGFIEQENPIARAVWAGIAPGHRQVVRYLLETS